MECKILLLMSNLWALKYLTKCVIKCAFPQHQQIWWDIFPAGNTIDCFECNSWDDPRCHDPWNWTYPKVWWCWLYAYIDTMDMLIYWCIYTMDISTLLKYCYYGFIDPLDILMIWTNIAVSHASITTVWWLLRQNCPVHRHSSLPGHNHSP